VTQDNTQALGKVRSILSAADAPPAEANLALTGDKQFLFSGTGKSFIMYGVKGRHMIAMGLPVGLAAERKPLIAAFRELAKTNRMQASFYAARADGLTDLLDARFAVQKIGELALVDIENYDLAGGKKAQQRQARNRAVRAGCTFEVRTAPIDAQTMSALKSVSDEWLRVNDRRERGFSLGRFDPDVISRAPVAIVRMNSEIVAFANLWETCDRSEIAVDVMRYRETGLTGVMDYLFVEIMLWAGAQGYRRFNMGMAPLAGLEAQRFTPVLSRLGTLMFNHGGRFYDFKGLRRFKKKFGPVWEPVYIAAPRRMAIPKVLGHLALLRRQSGSGA